MDINNIDNNAFRIGNVSYVKGDYYVIYNSKFGTVDAINLKNKYTDGDLVFDSFKTFKDLTYDGGNEFNSIFELSEYISKIITYSDSISITPSINTTEGYIEEINDCVFRVSGISYVRGDYLIQYSQRWGSIDSINLKNKYTGDELFSSPKLYPNLSYSGGTFSSLEELGEYLSSLISYTPTSSGTGGDNFYVDNINFDSSSGQLNLNRSGLPSISSSLDGRYLTGVPNGTVSGSSQVDYNSIQNKPTIIQSGSDVSQFNNDAGYLTEVPNGTVSGSSQIDFSGISNKPTLVSGSGQIDYNNIQNKPTIIQSGSDVSQFNNDAGYISSSVNNYVDGISFDNGLLTLSREGLIDLNITIDGRYALSSSLSNYQLLSDKGVANGYAPLNGSGIIDSSFLPSFVDDVIEVADYASLPTTGEIGKLYITLDDNGIYRWSGSTYISMSSGSSIAWGSITGLLSNQTDLATKFNEYLPLTGGNVTGVTNFSTDVSTQSALRVGQNGVTGVPLRLYGTNNGTTSVNYMQFNDNDGTRAGYFGFPSSNHSDILIYNDISNTYLAVTNTFKWYDGTGTATVWHSRNDGAGSGLDADLLDGVSWGNVNTTIHTSGGINTGIAGTSNGSVNTYKDDNGVITRGWENDYWRERIGGSGTIYGWKWNNFNTDIMTLTSGGVMFLYGGAPRLDVSVTGNSAVSRIGSNDSGGYWIGTDEATSTTSIIRSYGVTELHGGQVISYNGGFAAVSNTDGATLFSFNTDRPWRFKQLRTGSSTGLGLQDTSGSKSFFILDPSGNENITFTSSGNITAKSTTSEGYVNGEGFISGEDGFRRLTTKEGILIGSYSSDGGATGSTGAIYAMGTGFKPNLTTLGNMYGVGYAYGIATFLNSTDLGTTPSNKWGMYIAADGNARHWFNATDGISRQKGAAYASNFILNSDIRRKNNVEDYSPSEMNVEWKSFELKTEKGVPRVGVSAQQLLENHPEFVEQTDKENYTVRYIDLLCAKMAEKDKQIESLEDRIKRLEELILNK